jgi:hypothetical protein
VHIQLSEDGLEVIPCRVHANAEYVGDSRKPPVADQCANDLSFSRCDAQPIDRRLTRAISEQGLRAFVFEKRPQPLTDRPHLSLSMQSDLDRRCDLARLKWFDDVAECSGFSGMGDQRFV